MSRHLGLRTRIRRLEKRRGARRQRPTIIFTIHGEPAERIVGLQGMAGQHVSRLWAEPLAACASRARDELGAPRAILTAVYPPEPADAPVAAPGGAVAAPQAPPPAPPSDRKAAWAEYRQEKGW